MNDKKLREAFLKVKKDMDNLNLKLSKLEKQNSNTISNNVSNKDKSKNKKIEQEFEEFAQMMDEKVSMEIAGIKLEFESQIARLSSELTAQQSEEKRLDLKSKQCDEIENKVENSLGEFSEILNDRVTLEINSLKSEFTEEVAKLYDKFFNEIVEFKSELNNIKKNFKPEEKKKEKKGENKKKIKSKVNVKEEEKKEDKSLYESEFKEENGKKESKLKKVAKWLFVDEDEENEIDSIKDEVKKSDNKK